MTPVIHSFIQALQADARIVLKMWSCQVPSLPFPSSLSFHTTRSEVLKVL
jgi:hypothetical protein